MNILRRTVVASGRIARHRPHEPDCKQNARTAAFTPLLPVAVARARMYFRNAITPHACHLAPSGPKLSDARFIKSLHNFSLDTVVYYHRRVLGP